MTDRTSFAVRASVTMSIFASLIIWLPDQVSEVLRLLADEGSAGRTIIFFIALVFGGVSCWYWARATLYLQKPRAETKKDFEGWIVRQLPRVLGVLPFVPDLAIQEEDAIPETKWKNAKPYDPNKINVEVILLPHISNATDFDSLEREPDVIVHYLARVPLSLEPPPDLLILPGSKSTIADLAYLRSEGFAEHIYRCHDRKVPIAGICGGFQMLGKHLLDPSGVESNQKNAEGLGLLNLTTTFESEKRTERTRARSIDYDSEVEGYEIHMGWTTTAAPCSSSRPSNNGPPRRSPRPSELNSTPCTRACARRAVTSKRLCGGVALATTGEHDERTQHGSQDAHRACGTGGRPERGDRGGMSAVG